MKYIKNLNRTYIVLTPPRDNKQSIYAADQLFTLLHQVGRATRFETFLGIEKTLSCELVSTKEEGIRFIISCDTKEKEIIKNMLRSHVPGILITEIADYIPTVTELSGKKFTTVEFTLQNHFAFPLQTQSQLAQYDPIVFISRQITTLAPEELISIQYLLTPVTKQTHPRLVRHISHIQQTYHDGFDLSLVIRKKNNLRFVLLFPLQYIVRLLAFSVVFLFTFFGNYFTPDQTEYPFWVLVGEKPRKREKLSQQKQQEQLALAKKLEKELFTVTIRVLISLQSKKATQERMQGLQSSLASLATAKQRLQKKSVQNLFSRVWVRKNTLLTQLKYRIHSHVSMPVLSVIELACLYHFSHFPATRTEDLQKTFAKQIPAL